MTTQEINELKILAEFWHNQSNKIRALYEKTSPNLVKHCCTILENHAEELESFMKNHDK